MKKEDLQRGYDFLFLGGENHTYVFVTAHEIIYEVKFKPSSYLFAGNPILQDNAFEFSLLIADNPHAIRPPLDSLIPQTIANIFFDFFTNRDRIIVYICDSSDLKQAARNRKFDSWFHYYKGLEYFKTESMLYDKSGIVYYTSLIMRKDNPYKIQIIEAFDNLTSGYTDPK